MEILSVLYISVYTVHLKEYTQRHEIYSTWLLKQCINIMVQYVKMMESSFQFFSPKLHEFYFKKF